MLANPTRVPERGPLTARARIVLLATLAACCLGLALVPELFGAAALLCLAIGMVSGHWVGQRMALVVGGAAALAVLAARLAHGEPLTTPLLVGVTSLLGGVAVSRIRELEQRLEERRARRQGTEAALRARQQEHEALLQALPDAICRIDRAGTILSGHGRAERRGTIDVAWSVGKNVADILPPQVAQSALESVQDVLTNEQIVTFEYRLGSYAPRDLEARMVRSGAHEVLAIIRDITDIKKLEQKLNETHRDALHAAGTKGRFLATMSHQIRTPMNGVVGMTNVLLQTRLSPEQREYTTIIRNSGEALLSILDDVLDYNKIEDGQIELGRSPFPLRALLEELVELLAARAHDKGLEIASIIDARVPAWVQGDRGRLRQVIINLLGNAIKFTHQGHVALRVAVVGHDRDTALIRFDVSDTGVGITTEHQKNLFQDYGQAHRAIAREYGGTGLGLAISREIVELMGGRMVLESSEGAGSTFSFTARMITVQDRTTGSFLLPRALSGAHIVSLPLHPLTREIVEQQLAPFGAKVVIAEDLEQLAELLAQSRSFDAALVELPLGIGEKAAETLVAALAAACGNVPIAALCSLAQRTVIDHVRRAGAAAVLSRPLRRSSLYDSLVALLGLTARPAARSASAAHSPAAAGELRARVLVAEDNLVNQKVAVRTLEMLGCQAEVAENGALAVEAFKQRDFDVVLMDCQMPVLDGFEAARHIRALERAGRRVPIIAVTANAMQGDRERCLQAGMDDYLPKPVTMATLDEVLRRWLPEQSGYDARGDAAPEGA
jgi:two-component system, sensor histidine kinase and response regulator